MRAFLAPFLFLFVFVSLMSSLVAARPHDKNIISATSHARVQDVRSRYTHERVQKKYQALIDQAIRTTEASSHTPTFTHTNRVAKTLLAEESIPAQPYMLNTVNIYSVRDFGAVGNGQVDDTAAFNKAIAAAATTGGHVYVPVGFYQLTSSLNITAGVVNSFVMFGDGDSSLLWYNTNFATSLINIGNIPHINVKLFDLVFWSTNQAAGEISSLVSISNADHTFLARLTFVGIAQPAALVNVSTLTVADVNVYFLQNVATIGSSGFYFSNITNVWMTAVQVMTPSDAHTTLVPFNSGIVSYDVLHLVIENSLFYELATALFASGADGHQNTDIVVKSILVIEVNTGVYSYFDGARLTVTDSTFIFTAGDGILVQGVSTGSHTDVNAANGHDQNVLIVSNSFFDGIGHSARGCTYSVANCASINIQTAGTYMIHDARFLVASGPAIIVTPTAANSPAISIHHNVFQGNALPYNISANTVSINGNICIQNYAPGTSSCQSKDSCIINGNIQC